MGALRILVFPGTQEIKKNEEENTMSTDDVSRPMVNENVKMPEVQHQFLYGLYEFAADYFASEMAPFRGNPEPMEFCRLRGVSESRLLNGRVGFAPEPGDVFCDLVRQHCSEQVMIECGLFSWKEGAKMNLYSKFRNRLMFPFYNDAGDVVAFHGLSLYANEKQGPPWIETPCTAIRPEPWPSPNLKNIATYVLQLELLAAGGRRGSLRYDSTQLRSSRPMRGLVRTVGILGGMRYDDDRS